MTDRVEALRQAAEARHNATRRRAKEPFRPWSPPACPSPSLGSRRLPRCPGPGSTAKTTSAPKCNATEDRVPPSPSREHATSRQPSSPSANSSTPTEKRSPAYEPRTVPSTTSSPAASGPNEQTMSPGREHRRRHVHDVKDRPIWAFPRSGKENVHYGK